MDREAAWDLLCEYTKGDGLRKHGLAVEAVMRHFARKRGEDEETWGVAGLLHDFDYEAHPNEQQHPSEGAVILRARGYPEEIVLAILGHADYTGVPRDTPMAKTLYAVDELAGFVTAVALVRPNKSVHEVEPRSVGEPRGTGSRGLEAVAAPSCRRAGQPDRHHTHVHPSGRGPHR